MSRSPKRRRAPEQSHVSVADATYAAIRRAIIRCELEPGRRLTEADLAERYGTAKATVRLVLNRLTQEHLILVLPREGYRVTPITLKQVHDLFGARLVVEPAVAKLAAGRFSAEQLDELRTLSRVSYTVEDPRSREVLLEANSAFHLAIAQATGNERLVRMTRDLLDEMERIIHFQYSLSDRSQETYEEHLEIIEALASGDGEHAERIAQETLIDDRRVLIEALATSPALQSINLATYP